MLADRRHPPSPDRLRKETSHAIRQGRRAAIGRERRRRFSASALAAGVAGLLVAGCSNLFEQDNALPPADLTNFEASIDLREIWSKRVSSGTGDEHIKLPPTRSEDRIVVAGHDGDVSAYSLAEGKRIWEIDTGIEISGGPGAGFGRGVVGSREGQVIAFSLADGSRLWEARVSSEILSTPAIGRLPSAKSDDSNADGEGDDQGGEAQEGEAQGDTVVIVRTVDGRLFALDGDDGGRIWIHDSTVPALSLRGTGNPVVAGDRVIAGFDSGLLAAIGLASGEVLWEVRLGTPSGRSELDRLVDIDAGPSISDDRVYSTVFQERIAAVGLQDGRIGWERELSSHTGATPGSQLYVADENDHLWALDIDSGEAIWRQEGLAHRRLTRPVEFVSLSGEYLVVADLAGYIHWIDAKNGNFAARSRASWRRARVSAVPLVTDDAVFVLDDRGTLTALTIESPNP